MVRLGVPAAAELAGHLRLEAPSRPQTAVLWAPEQSCGRLGPAVQPWTPPEAPSKTSGLAAFGGPGLSCAQAVAFGDNHNDVEMLRAAGLGCAMANAKPAVKQAADVTLRWSNAEDGVARQCEKLQAEGRLRPPHGAADRPVSSRA